MLYQYGNPDWSFFQQDTENENYKSLQKDAPIKVDINISDKKRENILEYSSKQVLKRVSSASNVNRSKANNISKRPSSAVTLSNRERMKTKKLGNYSPSRSISPQYNFTSLDKRFPDILFQEDDIDRVRIVMKQNNISTDENVKRYKPFDIKSFYKDTESIRDKILIGKMPTPNFDHIKPKYLQHRELKNTSKIKKSYFSKQSYLSNFDPLFIPCYNISSKYLDELVHHSKTFIVLECKYIFGIDIPIDENLTTEKLQDLHNIRKIYEKKKKNTNTEKQYNHQEEMSNTINYNNETIIKQIEKKSQSNQIGKEAQNNQTSDLNKQNRYQLNKQKYNLLVDQSNSNPYFPWNWRELSYDELIEACKKLLFEIDRNPTNENLAILYALLQSSYLLQFFYYLNIISAFSNWIINHPPKLVVHWHLRILRKTKWNSMYGIDLMKVKKNIYFTKEIQETLLNISKVRDEIDPLLATKAFSVLRCNLPNDEVVNHIQHTWKETVKKGFVSQSLGHHLLANNVLHAMNKYSEASKWNIQIPLVRIVYENIDDEETLKAIENLVHLTKIDTESIILAGGFKLCLDFLNHEKTKIRSHVLLLFRVLCENSSRQFMIFPFNMGIISKLSEFIYLNDEISIQITANAFNAISSMLKNSEYNNSQKIQDFHVVHTQIAAQKVLHQNFEKYNESIEDLINGASECLYLSLLGSIERSTYALNNGILQRILHLIQTGPSTITLSLLNLLLPVCASRLSTIIVFEIDDHLLNPLVVTLKKIANSKDQDIRKSARNALLRLARILKLDTFELFKEYTPSNPMYRNMCIPKDVIERTRKDQVFLKPSQRKHVAQFMKLVSTISPPRERPKSASSSRSYSRIELDSYKEYRSKIEDEDYYEIDENFFKKNKYTEINDIEFKKLIETPLDESSLKKMNNESNELYENNQNPYISKTMILSGKIDSPPYPRGIEIKERNLNTEDSQLIIQVTKQNSVIAYKKTPNGAKSLEILRMCSYCATTSFTIAYKCYHCETIFCSIRCRKEALEKCHLKCRTAR